MTYKDEQEIFVGNLQGTDLWYDDFILCLALLPMAILLLEVAQGVSLRVNPVQDSLFLVLPITLALTVLSEVIPLLLTISVFVVMLLFLYKHYVSNRHAPSSVTVAAAVAVATSSSTCCNDLQTMLPDTPITQELSSSADDKDNDKKKSPSSRVKLSFITLFRGGNLLMTCLSILAIDFHVYPRRFGKTELYGFSLMDTGAATFVIASAITSKYARNVNLGASNKSGSSMQYLVVLGLGVGRMVIIKALGYQEHVSEYGTTWNFFVTLCFVWLIADVLHKYILVSPPPTTPPPSESKSNKPSSIWEFIQSIQIPLLCISVMGIYQYFLSFRNLTDFIIHAPRGTSFFASNREGILSLCGYTPMYLLAEWFSGRYFFNQSAVSYHSSTSTSTSSRIGGKSGLGRGMHALLVSAGVCGIGWYLSSAMLQPTSRRLTNMSFVLMILCLAALMLAALMVVDTLGHHFTITLGGERTVAGTNNNDKHNNSNNKNGEVLQRLPSKTMEIMSKHQLVVFMIANVLTGAINISMQTLYIPDHWAFLIICGYITVVVLLSWMFDRYFYG